MSESPTTRLFRDPREVDKREERVDISRVRPLNEWVRSVRARYPGAIVPWFDPEDGGVDATILWLLEAPGPKATRERGGSGFISSDNNDQSAANTTLTRAEAGVDRTQTVLWNAVPYYLGTETRITAHSAKDIDEVGHLLAELLDLLPALQVVILGGGAATKMWNRHAPGAARSRLKVIESPHPSPTNVNTRSGTYEKIVAAWEEARREVTPSPR